MILLYKTNAIFIVYANNVIISFFTASCLLTTTSFYNQITYFKTTLAFRLLYHERTEMLLLMDEKKSLKPQM